MCVETFGLTFQSINLIPPELLLFYHLKSTSAHCQLEDAGSHEEISGRLHRNSQHFFPREENYLKLISRIMLVKCLGSSFPL